MQLETIVPRRRQPPILRFWKQTKVVGGCIEWVGARKSGSSGKTHGVFGKGGRGNLAQAHRWIYEQVLGPVDPKLVVRHACDNPGCVTLQHLEVGTVKQNHEDMDRSGRRGRANIRGEQHGMAILTDDDVLTIRSELIGRSHVRGLREGIARRYGVSKSTIDRVADGRRQLSTKKSK